jgi:hypothetical protein
MSSARFEHFIFGIALWVAYLFLKQRRGDRLLLHPVVFAVTLPVLYLGTALPDWDITVFGIGGHRHPLFHSSLPYFCLAWLWRKLGLADVVHTIGGARLGIALHVGFILGLASHMVLDVWQYGHVRWIPGGTLGRLWLSTHALLLGLIAWYPQYALLIAAKPRSTV